MNKNLWYVGILILVVLALWAGFYYKNGLVKFYDGFGKKVQSSVQAVQKTDVASTINQITKQVLAPSPLNVGGTANSVVLTKARIIAQTNIQRFDNGGLPPLIENTKLDAAALAKANDIFKNQYFAHISPSGVDPGALIESFGYDYAVSGENLILGNFSSEQEVLQDWMNSPGHRANILNNRFVDIGAAVVKGTYQGQTAWVGVQEFGLPLSACQSPDATLKAQIDSDNSQLTNFSTQLVSEKAQIDSTSQSSPQYNNLVDEYNNLAAQYNQLLQTTKNLIETYNNQINAFNQCVAGT